MFYVHTKIIYLFSLFAMIPSFTLKYKHVVHIYTSNNL